MDGLALIGILLIFYAAVVVFLTINRPPAIWNIKKIQMFEKALGKKGTIIFFYIWATISLVIGIWLLRR